MSRILGLLVLCLACGGGAYAGGVYRDGEAVYRLSDPGDGWRRMDVRGENDLAWTHEGHAAIIQANASCNPGLDIPLTALTNHLLIGFTERELATQELVPMDGREALRTHMRAKLDGVPRELLLVVLKKDGCVYDFALVAPLRGFTPARASYDAMLQSFRTES